MRRNKIPAAAVSLVLAGTVLAVCGDAPAAPGERGVTEASASAAAHHGVPGPINVSGSAVHFFSTAIVHSQEPTGNGMIQRSTDIVHLTGDLSGYLVFHATSTFDFEGQSLVNTGTQFFSGTVAGSAPVVLHDDTFRFTVDLTTGETRGEVRLRRSKDAPHTGAWYECDLAVVGSGSTTPEGDGIVDYTGTCTPQGSTRSAGAVSDPA